MKLEEVNQKDQESMQQEESAAEQEVKTEEGKERKKRAVILLAVLVFLLGGAAIIFASQLLGSGQGTEEPENVAGEIMPGLPDGMDEGEIAAELQKQIDESMFTVSVNTRPVFQNGNAKGKVDIINAPQNHYPCKVTLTLDEDGTVLYENSDLLYPEQYIPEIKLSKNLKKGVYDATLMYRIYEENGEKQTGLMSAKMQIIIQN